MLRIHFYICNTSFARRALGGWLRGGAATESCLDDVNEHANLNDFSYSCWVYTNSSVIWMHTTSVVRLWDVIMVPCVSVCQGIRRRRCGRRRGGREVQDVKGCFNLECITLGRTGIYGKRALCRTLHCMIARCEWWGDASIIRWRSFSKLNREARPAKCMAMWHGCVIISFISIRLRRIRRICGPLMDVWSSVLNVE